MKYNKKTEWITHMGNTVSVGGIEDTHLANVIQFLTYYKKCIEILKAFKKEAKCRGLSEEFLSKAQYPYKDGKGNYLVWDFKTMETKVIGSYLRG